MEKEKKRSTNNRNRREIMDTHIHLNKERFQIRRKKERPVICKNAFRSDIQKTIAEVKRSIARNVEGLCNRRKSMNAEKKYARKTILWMTKNATNVEKNPKS